VFSSIVGRHKKLRRTHRRGDIDETRISWIFVRCTCSKRSRARSNIRTLYNDDGNDDDDADSQRFGVQIAWPTPYERVRANNNRNHVMFTTVERDCRGERGRVTFLTARPEARRDDRSSSVIVARTYDAYDTHTHTYVYVKLKANINDNIVNPIYLFFLEETPRRLSVVQRRPRNTPPRTISVQRARHLYARTTVVRKVRLRHLCKIEKKCVYFNEIHGHNYNRLFFNNQCWVVAKERRRETPRLPLGRFWMFLLSVDGLAFRHEFNRKDSLTIPNHCCRDFLNFSVSLRP